MFGAEKFLGRIFQSKAEAVKASGGSGVPEITYIDGLGDKPVALDTPSKEPARPINGERKALPGSEVGESETPQSKTASDTIKPDKKERKPRKRAASKSAKPDDASTSEIVAEVQAGAVATQPVPLMSGDSGVPQQREKNVSAKTLPDPVQPPKKTVYRLTGDIFKNLHTGEKIKVEGVSLKDGEAEVPFTEYNADGVIKYDKKEQRKPLKNFDVAIGVKGMVKIDSLQEERPLLYKAYEKEMSKIDDAFGQDYEASGKMMDAWKEAIEENYGQSLRGEVKDLDLRSQGLASLAALQSVKVKIEAIGKEWNVLDGRFLESGRRKMHLLAEIRALTKVPGETSVEAPTDTLIKVPGGTLSLHEVIPDDFLRLKQEELEASKDYQETKKLDSKKLEKLERMYRKIYFQQTTIERLNEIKRRLKDKADRALAGRGVAFVGDEAAIEGFGKRITVLLKSINDQSSPEETEKVLAELSELEERMFTEENEYENGHNKRKGKLAKKVHRGGLDKEESVQKILQEASPSILWGEIETLQSGLRGVMGKIKDDAERDRQLAEVDSQVTQAKGYFDAFTEERARGGRGDLRKIELLRRCKGRLTRMYLDLRVGNSEESDVTLSEFKMRVEKRTAELADRIKEADTFQKLENIGIPETRKDAKSGREYTVREFVKETDTDLREVTDQLMEKPTEAALAAAHLKDINTKLLGSWEAQARVLKKRTRADKPRFEGTTEADSSPEVLDAFKKKVQELKQRILLRIEKAESPQTLGRIGKKEKRYDSASRGKGVYFVREFLKETDVQLKELAEKIHGRSQLLAVAFLKEINNDLGDVWNRQQEALGGRARDRKPEGKKEEETFESVVPLSEQQRIVGELQRYIEGGLSDVDSYLSETGIKTLEEIQESEEPEDKERIEKEIDPLLATIGKDIVRISKAWGSTEDMVAIIRKKGTAMLTDMMIQRMARYMERKDKSV